MQSNYSNYVKIIAGKYKGKILKVLDAEGLRPTPSRVRETVFTWIKDSLEGAKVLDLFAGSGALGFEAVSRGASSLTMIELDKNNAQNLKNTASGFKNENIIVHNTDALKFLENDTGTYDIVFVDPPYKLDVYSKVLSTLLKRKLINDSTLIYVEMRNGSNQAVPGFEIFKEECAGAAKYALWRKSQLLF